MNGDKLPPFQRALRFLQYRRLHQYTAITGSIVQATLVLLLLGLAGLFMALLISRGRLDAQDRQKLLQDLQQQRAKPGEDHTDEVGTDLVSWVRLVIPHSHEQDEFQKRLERDEGVGLVALAWSAHKRGTIWAPVLEWMVYSWPWTRRNWEVMMCLLTVALVAALLRWGLTLLVHWSAAEAVLVAAMRLRRTVYFQTYRLGSLLLKRQGSNLAISVFTRHIEAVQEGLYLCLTSRWREPARLVLLVVFAPLIEFGTSGEFPFLTLGFVCLAGLIWVVGAQLFAWYRQHERAWNQQAAEQLSLLQEGLRLMRLVKGFLMEAFHQQRIERQLGEYERQVKQQLVGRVAFQQTMVLLGLIGLSVLAFVAAWNTLLDRMGLASILTLTLTLAALYFPITRLLSDRVVLKRAMESAEKLFDFLDQPGEVTETVQARFLEPMQRELQFENVSLRLPGENRQLLDHVSFTVQAGQRVALVGADRATLHAVVYLLARFYDPDEGSIRIDGHNIRRVTLESLRAQLGLVLQSDLVFTDTVANNIGCGDPAFKLPKIMEAAKIAHAHQFIQDLPRGYETVVGDQGHALTTLQRFQIALARAIIREPALVVIEEPAVHLTEEEKVLLEDTYTRFVPGRTTLFIPHRFQTLRNCDLVLFFHQGRLEGQGKHRELLNTSELYRQVCFVEFHLLADYEALPPTNTQQ